MSFRLISKFQPTGDQPKAIEQLTKNLKSGIPHQVLLGVTGSGKTFSISGVIENIQKPILVVSPNKTLCAQLYQEFKEFFPHNAVHYFVSYYDYYQPEAYIPQTNTYIEKDAKVNEEIDRLRHAAVQDVLGRKDIIVVASVSCIYNIGSPENYQKVSLELKAGQKIKRKDFLARLTNLQYQRNDSDFKPGTFRVRGDIVEIFPVTGKEPIKIEFSGNRIETISGKKTERIFPARFWVTPEDKLPIALENIHLELQERLQALKRENKLVEAQRLEQRTQYDLQMLKENGWCHGIENYSRHFEFREPGEAPFTLIDYFNYFHPTGFLFFIDESHIALPQLRAMAVQDKIRKETLVEHGFRLPSAIDNRPLTFKELNERVSQAIYVSATPAIYERQKAGTHIVEQLIRPTGLLEPSIEIRPTKNQLTNLLGEIRKRVTKQQRTLVLTITKRLAEAVSEWLSEQGVKTEWLHSEIKTLQRPELLRNFRLGKFDVLVGINLLREGLDLPEVSLVVILDADKEGFLRNETTLIQTMGRAARHLEGHIILYADTTTQSMVAAMKEVQRRKTIQERYNKEHNITPQPITKEVREWLFAKKDKETTAEFGAINDKKLLKKEMREAAKNLDFERAAEIRDLIKSLKKQ